MILNNTNYTLVLILTHIITTFSPSYLLPATLSKRDLKTARKSTLTPHQNTTIMSSSDCYVSIFPNKKAPAGVFAPDRCPASILSIHSSIVPVSHPDTVLRVCLKPVSHRVHQDKTIPEHCNRPETPEH